MLEKGYHFIHDNGGGHLLHKLGQVCRGLATDHGRVIVHQVSELLAELLLDVGGHLFVGGRVETAARHLRREPVGFGKADGEGDEILLHLL